MNILHIYLYSDIHTLMGIIDSKHYRSSKEEKQQKEVLKNNMIQKQIEKINKVQETIWDDAKTKNIVNYQEFNKLMEVGNIAKNQLSKGGSILTKSDLIAICLRLDPTLQTDVSRLQNYTISDLNTTIRCIIYNVNTIDKSNNLRLLV